MGNFRLSKIFLTNLFDFRNSSGNGGRTMQHPKPKAPAKIRVGNTTMRWSTAIDMMAQEIVARSAEGCVREISFVNLGFNARQIAQLAPDAYRKAAADHPHLIELLAA
jgi:hypothetical protein